MRHFNIQSRDHQTLVTGIMTLLNILLFADLDPINILLPPVYRTPLSRYPVIGAVKGH